MCHHKNASPFYAFGAIYYHFRMPFIIKEIYVQALTSRLLSALKNVKHTKPTALNPQEAHE